MSAAMIAPLTSILAALIWPFAVIRAALSASDILRLIFRGPLPILISGNFLLVMMDTKRWINQLFPFEFPSIKNKDLITPY